MIQIKKTLLTLALLITAATGAWAQDVLNLVLQGTSATIKYDGNASNNPILGLNGWEQDGDPWDTDYTTKPTITTVTIDGSCKNFSGTSLSGLFEGFSGLTTINGFENLNTANVQDMSYMFYYCMSLTSLDLSSWNTARVTMMYYMFSDCSKLTTVDLSGWNTEHVEATSGLFYDCSNLENIYVGDGWSTAAVMFSDEMFTGCAKLLSMNTANPATDKTNAHTGDGGYLKVNPASGPKVAWDKAEKTGQFTMPGGNVTLEPEYYPQAALTVAPTAINDVPATTDGAIVNAGTVANIGETTNAQGTVMYYVSQTEMTDAALLALAADKWTADVPTAQSLAQGQAYVYYYVRGNDGDTDETTFSDGDIVKAANAIQVTLAAAPLWNAEFDLTNAPEEDKAGKWSTNIPEGGVVKGTEVTVTYTGSKKVIGVKATSDAAPAGPTYNETKSINDGPVTVAAGEHWLITGTGTQTSNTMSIGAGATVTLDGVNIRSGGYCIKCAGDATIILKDNSENTLTSTSTEYPALSIGDANTTLTIQGSTGVLNVTSGDWCAGIGGGYKNTNKTCGNIRIEGGVITAQGGSSGAGIGTDCAPATCGNIIITGGTITAKGGRYAAGIGTGGGEPSPNVCGDITIASTVTKVTATKGESASHSIGKGNNENVTCGTITIGGTGYGTDGVSTSPYTYQPSN